MRCHSCDRCSGEEGLLAALQDERAALADALRNETAQTLAAILLDLGALGSVGSDDARTQVAGLRAAVHAQLDDLLLLIARLDQRRRASCLDALPSTCSCEPVVASVDGRALTSR